MRAALTQPFGIALLGAGIVLAVGVLTVPVLDRWAGQWLLIAGWGFLGYGATVLARLAIPQEPAEPELREIRSIRDHMASALGGYRRTGSRSTALTDVVAEAVDHLDKQVTPALEQLLARQQELDALLQRYDSGALPLPQPAVLDRLRAIQVRQRRAIAECVQQASNAAGTLTALLQEGDDATVAAEAQAWARGLLDLYDTLADVLRGEAGSDWPAAQPAPAPAPPAAQEKPPAPEEPNADPDIPRLVGEALRQLNTPATLSRSDLISRLPATLEAISSRTGTAAASPIAQAQALRVALIEGIEQLRPHDDGPSTELGAVQYHILYDEYVQGKSTRYIMLRHSISESTFYRYRREAVAALAHHLCGRESLIAAGHTLSQARETGGEPGATRTRAAR